MPLVSATIATSADGRMTKFGPGARARTRPEWLICSARRRRRADVEAESVEARPHRGLARRARHDLRSEGGQQRFGVDDLLSVVAAVGEHHRQPVRHVVDRRAGTARRGLGSADPVRRAARSCRRRGCGRARGSAWLRSRRTGSSSTTCPSGLQQHLVAEVLPRLARADGHRLGPGGQARSWCRRRRFGTGQVADRGAGRARSGGRSRGPRACRPRGRAARTGARTCRRR